VQASSLQSGIKQAGSLHHKTRLERPDRLG